MSSSSPDKQKAANYIEHHFGPDLAKAGGMADGSTETVTGTAPFGHGSTSTFAPAPTMPAPDSGPGKLHGWETQEALSYAMNKWAGQLSKLVGRARREMESLRGAEKLIHGNDHRTGAKLSTDELLVTPEKSHSRISDL
ncbi:hypothetical protein [Streptomyces qinglanensis]|uniref:Uncharacterized protein n=1 Tax=Streptomyces qinglanensis TaxID=943816 RepID=A0A1H9NH30_9ACTN|nr:hypothetical protein [Streptomyces qinglanensis]SER34975.1 hypothetical protein SAMN05421870_101372 [Streptomyces qinglanensis]